MDFLRKIFCLPTLRDLDWGGDNGYFGLPIEKSKEGDYTWSDYEALIKSEYKFQYFICRKIPSVYNMLIGYHIKSMREYVREKIDKMYIVDCRYALKDVKTKKYVYDFEFYTPHDRLLTATFSILLREHAKKYTPLNLAQYDSDEYHVEQRKAVTELLALIEWWKVGRKVNWDAYWDKVHARGIDYRKVKSNIRAIAEVDGDAATIERDSEEGKAIIKAWRESRVELDKIEKRLYQDDIDAICTIAKHSDILN